MTATQPRLRDAGIRIDGVSSGRFATKPFADGSLTPDDPVAAHWDAVAELNALLSEAAPEEYTERQRSGHRDATAQLNINVTGHVRWDVYTVILEREWAKASDEGAPWRDPETTGRPQEHLDEYWDARADRLNELWSAFRAASPAFADSERDASPDWCAHCGYGQRSHGIRWTPAAHDHSWAEPSPKQRKTRMLARRAGRAQTV